MSTPTIRLMAGIMRGEIVETQGTKGDLSVHNFDPHCPRCIKRRDESGHVEEFRAHCHFRCPWRGQPAQARPAALSDASLGTNFGSARHVSAD